MTLVDLARRVREVRDLQREYFRTRDRAVLERSRAAEQALDRHVEDILKPRPLFAEELD